MAMEFAALGTWVEPLIEALSAPQRARLAADLGRTLARAQTSRIRAQRDPDGAAYAPRLPQRVPAHGGEIRRGAMYRKLAGMLRVESDADGARIRFPGSLAGHIARVAQEGLPDAVRPGGPYHTYAQRRLLGFSADDVRAVEERVIIHLERAL